ncbi:MAG: hypothetical protein L6V81_03750 [Clostridium sp.]|nr:MAG: hypothetical protein L6V81_03750 [Clostridium sp.]
MILIGLRNLKLMIKKIYQKYIMGLPYEDDKGWMYLESECNCTLNRINNNTYEIELKRNFLKNVMKKIQY